MAIYKFSTVTNISAFNPATDKLSFDSASIDALSVSIAESGTGLNITALVNAVNKTITLPGMSLKEITPTNLVFVSGSKYLVGDNLAGTVNDDNANVLTGGSGRDFLDGLGGNDTLNGLAGKDYLRGGAGDDLYFVDDSDDQVVENNVADGIDTVRSTANFILPVNVDNLELQGSAALSGTGNTLNNIIKGNTGSNLLDGSSGNDTLTGNAGADTLNGGSGNDFMDGGTGNDIYVVDSAYDITYEGSIGGGVDTVQSSVSWGLEGFFENLTLTGTGTINGIGNDDNNIILGNMANNILDGGLGNDRMEGGDGNDSYYVNTTGDVVVETNSLTTQIDLVESWITYTLPTNVEQVHLLGANNINATGNASDNLVYANSGNNVINGLTGIDTVSYEYLPDSPTASFGVQVSLATTAAQNTIGGGTDTLSNIENLTGSKFNDTLTGNTGSNRLDGKQGADTLIGGNGNDTYVVDGGDTVIETNADLNQKDTVESSVDYRLPANVENLTLTGLTAINATGNALVNTLIGNDSANVLDGGAGADVLKGGKGDDIYIVDGDTDTIFETVNEGTDSVYAAINYSLGNLNDVEKLYLTGSSNINGSGNAQANTIYANRGNNILDGGHNLASTLVDTVSYEFGTATTGVTIDLSTQHVTGGSGVDTLIGFDNATGSYYNDTIVANQNGNIINGLSGIDRVSYANATGDIKANLTGLISDTLTVSGKDQLLNIENLTGGKGNDTIVMSIASNAVDGGAGSDTVSYETHIRGVIVDLGITTKQAPNGSGYDTLTNIENIAGTRFDDKLIGNGGNNTLSGSDGNDELLGLGGADVLNGGVGMDKITGGTGADTFTLSAIFDSTDVGSSAKGVDTIMDFHHSEGDRVDLKALLPDTVTLEKTFAFLGTSPLTGNIGEVNYSVDHGNAIITGDTNGVVGYDFKIVLLNVTTLSAGDFIL